MYFISAAVILLASLAIIVQVSLPYNKTGKASVLYNFILVFLSCCSSTNKFSSNLNIVFRQCTAKVQRFWAEFLKKGGGDICSNSVFFYWCQDGVVGVATEYGWLVWGSNLCDGEFSLSS